MNCASDEASHTPFNTLPDWTRFAPWESVTRDQFLDWTWQDNNAIVSPKELEHLILPLCDPDLVEDMQRGSRSVVMRLRLTPHIVNLIDWSNIQSDPIFRQFVPLESQLHNDHPCLQLDSLHEKQSSPVTGIIHRYPTKALFLPIGTCQTFCRFCTRSYGVSTNHLFFASEYHWSKAFEYIKQHPELNDIVISGGDTSRLSADQIRTIGTQLLAIPTIRRFRFATRTLSVLPQKVLTDFDWTNAICEVAFEARAKGVAVAVHTHFNHPNEITDLSASAANIFFSEGIPVRNQSVLLRKVNDDFPTMLRLIETLAAANIQPYYVFQHDMVPGIEDLRTPLSTALELDKQLRGRTSGFMLPTFVIDLPGGGGKRGVHTFETYDAGVSTWRSPVIDPTQVYTYHDPVT